MSARNSPAVARRRLRLALRNLREENSFTQGEVAKRLEWSLSKVNRIEIGDVAVSGTDLQALLRLFNVTDEGRTATLTEDCRAARRREWWDKPDVRPRLTPATVELLQFQGDASRIYTFQLALIPGLVQTRSYAESVLAYWIGELSQEERSARLDVRMRWRSFVFDQPEPPRCIIVLDESTVSREVGGPGVMIEQLRELLQRGQDPNIEIRILPLVDAAFVASAAPFFLVELDDQDAVLYRENYMTDELIDAPAEVARYRDLMRQVLAKSLSVEASARLIEARVAALASSLDRR